MNVALCIPTTGVPTWGLLDSIARFQARHYREHPTVGVDVIRPPRVLPVDIARSYLAQCVLEAAYEWLWFVDQDCAFTPDTLDRLMAWQEPIVGALCLIRAKHECLPMAFGEKVGESKWLILGQEAYDYLLEYADITTNDPQVIDPVPDGSLVPVTFTGCHCLLIHRTVLESLEQPMFNGAPGTEDRNFCLKAGEAGFKVHVDFSTFAGHLMGERSIGVWDYMAHFRWKAYLEAVNERNGNETQGESEGESEG